MARDDEMGESGVGGCFEARLKLINLLDAQTEKAVQDSNDL